MWKLVVSILEFFFYEKTINLFKKTEFTFTFKGPALKWFVSYLFDRSLQVYLGNGSRGPYSSTINFAQVVPQGSLLGSLLFTLFVDDFLDGIVFQFADDTVIVIARRMENEFSRVTISSCCNNRLKQMQ